MSTQILMPALSPTMTEGTLARWLKKEGDSIAAGDVLAEIETDKATMEVEAVDEGVLGRILVPDGTANVAVNAPIGIMVDAGETVPTGSNAPPPSAASKADAQADTATPAPPPGSANSAGAGAKNAHAPAEPTTHTPSQPAPSGRVFASPLARRLASAASIDLATLTGTGPQGRIMRADVEQARATPASRPAPAPAPAAAPASAAPVPAAPATDIAAPHTLVPHTAMRTIIARRLTEAKQTIPHFYLTVDIDLDPLLALRATLNTRLAKSKPEAKLSVNDLLIKAAAATLRQIPAVNASYTEAGTVLYTDVDVSVAVSIPDGLITPIIRQADRKGLVAISTEMKDLARRAKAGKLKPEEFQGGGFSISNLGMFGIDSFAAIINAPQGAILAVGAGQQKPVIRDGALAIGTVMSCTLSVDHRVIDGALGAEWLAAFKSIIEDPLGIML